jgi:putative ABC transport system permease protein
MLSEWITALRLRTKALLRRRQLDRDLNDELQFHLAVREQKLIDQGSAAEEAHYAARREFRNATQAKEVNREMWAFPFLETLWQDIRYGLRQLRRSPGFTAVAVITLALGIGANTVILTIVNTVLLHALPYPNAGRIVDITRRAVGTDSVPMFTYWEQNNPGFRDLAAYTDQLYPGVNLTGGEKPEVIWARKVSVNYFRLFGANPILGRTFSSAEDRPGGPNVLVMSYGLWERRFGGDTKILGKEIALAGVAYTAIGVLSPRFRPFPATDVWIPLQADPNSTDQAHILMVAGRLPPGTTLAQANSWMKALGRRYVKTHPDQLGNDNELAVTPMQDRITGNLRPALLILLGAVGLVLLIACANVANLLLTRALGRQREIAIRSAVGAGRGRIVRQLLTESVLLALAGGGVGLAIGASGIRLVAAFAPGSLLSIQAATGAPAVNLWVAGFIVALAATTGILFGLFPALQLARTDLTASLKDSSPGTGTDPGGSRARDILVAAEIAFAVVLVCGAMLLIRSFIALHQIDPGFDPRNLLTMRVALAGHEYTNGGAVSRLARQIEGRLDRIPGVEAAAMGSSLPYGPISDMVFDIPGRPPLKGYKFTGDVLWCFVSPQYFKILKMPLILGRLFRDREPAHTVIINEAMARKFWPKRNPVGRSIVIGAGLGPELDQGPTEIAGIVGDVRDGVDAAPPPTMYQLWSQIPAGGLKLMSGLFPASIAVRTKPGVTPMSVSKAVQRALRSGGLHLPATQIQTMVQARLESTPQTNFDALLLGIFAAFALLLAAVGIFGVMSYTVRQRTHEIGIRMALGAQKADVLWLVLGQGLRLALTGVAAGIVGALGLARFLSSLLYGVKPDDPLTFIAVPILLAATAALACYIPARRAAKVDPMVALRHE